MIEVRSFTKKYGKVFAVQNASFLCSNNSITGLLGPNGAGKTTILKAIAGILTSKEEEIYIDGVSVNDFPEVIKENCGYVSESAFFNKSFTVLELLKETALIRSCGNNDIDRVITEYSLQSILQKKTWQVSKGFKQRIAFALALLHDPKNLILDEPVSGLDPLQILEMRNSIKKFSNTKTVLLSTHFISEALSLCNKLVIMKQGRVVTYGSAEDILLSTISNTLEEAFVKLTET